MAAVVALKVDNNLTVEPGQTATGELSLANTGTIVEQFTILVLGEAAEWTQVEPPVVSLFPQAQQVVTLRFSPPRVHTTPNGYVEFAVKVIPSNEPEESVVEEGAINVGTFHDVTAELVPRVATGRFTGKQRLAVDSRGNVPVPVAITAIDGAEALKFRVRPSKITTAPGEARFSRVSIRPRQRFWKGSPQQKPYQVQVAAGEDKPVVLDGALTQKAVLPKWLLPLLLLAALLLLLWFFVLRPIVKSTAVNANAAALAAQAAQTRSLSGQLAATKSSLAALSGAKPGAPVPAPGAPAQGASTTATATTEKATTSTATTKPGTPAPGAPAPGPPPAPGPGGPTSFSGPNDGRIEVVAAPGQQKSMSSPVVGPGSTLTVTDVVLENVGSGAGQVRVQRTLGVNKSQDLLVENLGRVGAGLEFRFNTPMQFTPGEAMTLLLACSGQEGACEAGVYYTGPFTQPIPTTTTTFP
ncbi:MAG: hypothetical protein M3063_06120 [Actinomycetota bacterium]|nr:hypothetical protein [Actinomycetota bacterium]